MSDGAVSPHWYRIAKLRPRLHDQVQIHRHDYRGLIWYLLENPTSGRSHRFNSSAYKFIGLMDGGRTVDEIYVRVCNDLEEFAPDQDTIIDLLSKLYEGDLLKSDMIADTEDLFERQVRHKASKLKQRIANPVALRFAIWDPEDFLNQHQNKVNWIFTKPVAALWLLLMVIVGLQAFQHWPKISHHFGVNALSPYNLLLMFLLYPPLKFVHELGHAFSAKLEGGEVHEMGVTFLLLMPVPYVNVSTATHFRSRHKRMLVSAAGILVELLIAALGLSLFLATQPGLVQDIGFNLFLIAGVSSLFFNGNPLLKYDGYYILADAVGIPNLFQRSTQYWSYFFQRYLFGLRDAKSPASAPGETAWFVSYSLLSVAYRLAILSFIVVVVAEKYFYLGVVLAVWLLGVQVFRPLVKTLQFVVASPALNRKRRRALISSTGILATLIYMIGFVPIPSFTVSEGIVWQPDEVQLRVAQDGFVAAVEVANNQYVAAGAPIVLLHDPLLQSQVKIARARVRELASQYRAGRANSSTDAGIVKDELRVAESELEFVQKKASGMTVDAFRDGKVILLEAADLPGRFVRKGDVLGYISNEEPPTIRMAVSQDHIGQLRQHIVDISVRFASKPQEVFTAELLRQSPEATNQLPSAALSTQGGGRFVVMPNEGQALVTHEKVFLVDLKPDFRGERIPLGSRAYVRVNHGGEPLASQWYRRLRQVFLSHLNV